MNAVKDKKGVTLVELIVVIAIMGIVLTAISGIFIYIPGFFKKANARSTLQSDAIVLMENIEVNLRTAIEVQIGGASTMQPLLSDALLNEYKDLKVEYDFNQTNVDKAHVIYVKITGKDYELVREIYLMNEPNVVEITTTPDGKDKYRIFIKKP